jgi:IS5 family transposase
VHATEVQPSWVSACFSTPAELHRAEEKLTPRVAGSKCGTNSAHQTVHAELAAPAFQDVRRRAVVKAAVNFAPAADAAALDVAELRRTQRHGLTAVAILLF